MRKLRVLAPTALVFLLGCGERAGNGLPPAVSLTVTPTAASLHVTGGQQFSVTVHNSMNQRVAWNLSGAGCAGNACGKISATGFYLAPTTVPNPAIVTVSATAMADRTKSAGAKVSIMPAILVSVSPVSPNVHVGRTQQFSATVQNAVNPAVTWSVTGTGCRGSACGTVDGSGLYTAPAKLPSPATVTVTATSVEDTTKSDAAVAVIVPAIIVKADSAYPGLLAANHSQATRLQNVIRTNEEVGISRADPRGTRFCTEEGA